jgi:hypothetical protein
MSLLAANQPTQQLVTDPPRHNAPHPLPRPIMVRAHGVPTISATLRRHNTGSATTTIEVMPGHIITTMEAENILTTYRERLVTHSPFVPLPPTQSALQLQHQHPLLFHAIVIVALPADLEIQPSLRQRFREIVAEKLVVNSDRFLEVLQAIVVYMSWSVSFSNISWL